MRRPGRRRLAMAAATAMTLAAALGAHGAPVPSVAAVVDPTCPAPWTCQDVGPSVPAGGNEVINQDGSWTITAGGTGIIGPGPDETRLVTRDITGDNQTITQVLGQSLQGTLPSAGVMERQSNDPGSPFFAAFMFPSDPNEGEARPKIVVEYRTVWGAAHSELTKVYPMDYPRYVMLTRQGSVFNASFSSDGAYWNLIPGAQTTVPMPATVMAGVAVNSGAQTQLGTAQMAHLTIHQPPDQVLHPKPTAHACPPGWTCGDTDDIAPQGDQQLGADGTWTLTGAGWDIGTSPDAFHYVTKTLAGDGTVSAEVTSVGASATGAKAGLMLRQSTDPGAPFFGFFVRSGLGAIVQWRKDAGVDDNAVVTLPATTAPAYLAISRFTDTSVIPNVVEYSALTSADGATWSFVPDSTQAIDMGAAPIMAGMAGTTHKPVTTNVSTFAGVTVSASSIAPPPSCPGPWRCTDVGRATPSGGQNATGGTWTVTGGGSDITNVADAFHFVSRPLSGDGAVAAHIAAQSNSNGWAKAGVMIRATTDTASPYYAVLVTPAHGVVVQYRSVQGGGTSSFVAVAAATAPVHVRVSRVGTTFSAASSADGLTWAPIANSSVVLPSIPGGALAGLAATSHDSTRLSTVMYDAVDVAATAPSCPPPWVCTDVGGATPAGGQSVHGATWTMTAGGWDISNPADALHLAAQTLAADGTVSAQVTSQTGTNAWAKAGLMIRAGTGPSAPYYAVLVTPAHGVVVQYRAAQGGATLYPAGVAAATVPIRLRIVRTGLTFSASTSADGVAWTTVPGSTQLISGLPGAVLAGLAATSHDGSALSTVEFDGVTVGP